MGDVRVVVDCPEEKRFPAGLVAEDPDEARHRVRLIPSAEATGINEDDRLARYAELCTYPLARARQEAELIEIDATGDDLQRRNAAARLGEAARNVRANRLGEDHGPRRTPEEASLRALREAPLELAF